MIESNKDISYVPGGSLIRFPEFEKSAGITAAFSTRHGGVSSGIYESMNLSFSVGDEDVKVQENYRRAAQLLGTDLGHMVLSDQTHTANVRIVTAEDAGKGLLREKDYQDVDGMITDVPGIMLCTSHSDCVPLYFADPVKKVIALSHSGWKGTAAKIGEVTVSLMRERFGSAPADIYALIGPAICRDCYEVSDDVADAFLKVFSREEAEDIMDEKGGGKYQLDLSRANFHVLKDSGIDPRHITETHICTFENSDILWSHRKTQGRRGGGAAFLMLKG